MQLTWAEGHAWDLGSRSSRRGGGREGGVVKNGGKGRGTAARWLFTLVLAASYSCICLALYGRECPGSGGKRARESGSTPAFGSLYFYYHYCLGKSVLATTGVDLILFSFELSVGWAARRKKEKKARVSLGAVVCGRIYGGPSDLYQEALTWFNHGFMDSRDVLGRTYSDDV